MKFELGTQAKDIVTGFTGIITGRVSYLTGCDQYLIQPPCAKKSTGDAKEARWFDENRVSRVGNKPALKLDTATANGPCDAAPIK